MKNKRQSAILDLIERYEIATQEDMQRYLEESGFRVTQATVSRDIRELKLYKGMGKDGVVRYRLAERPLGNIPKVGSLMGESVTSVDYAGNMVVVKTHPGMANAVATYIDALDESYVLGCVAGDDTIIAVTMGIESADYLMKKLRMLAGLQ